MKNSNQVGLEPMSCSLGKHLNHYTTGSIHSQAVLLTCKMSHGGCFPLRICPVKDATTSCCVSRAVTGNERSWWSGG